VRFDSTRLDRGGQQPLLWSNVNPKQWTPLCAHITPSLLLRQTIRRRRRDMMFEKKIYSQGTFCTVHLWRIAQQSRSTCLGFWLRSLFGKLLPHGLKKSKQGVACVVLAFSPSKSMPTSQTPNQNT
jgi:hypothetical protein